MEETRILEDLRDDHGRHFVGDDGLGLAVVEPQGLEGVDAEGVLVLHAAVSWHSALQGGRRDRLLCRAGRRTHHPWAAVPGRGGSSSSREERKKKKTNEGGGKKKREEEFIFQPLLI